MGVSLGVSLGVWLGVSEAVLVGVRVCVGGGLVRVGVLDGVCVGGVKGVGESDGVSVTVTVKVWLGGSEGKGLWLARTVTVPVTVPVIVSDPVGVTVPVRGGARAMATRPAQ